jgi:perosamine synthetase
MSIPTLAIHGGEPLIPTTPEQSQECDRRPVIESFTRYIGCRYGVTTCNGSASLISALVGAGVSAGDEVITVSYTWYTTVTSILAVNAVPIFVDIDPETFTMDPAQIEQSITPRTRAILAVSIYGQPANYPVINEIAKRHGLLVIDDACQSFGAAIDGRKLGTATSITAFSFSGKPIASTGGGLVTCDDEKIYERVLLAGQHPSTISTHARHPENHEMASTGGFGYNLRIDEKAAELACERLEHIDETNAHRRVNAHYLTERLRELPGITPPAERPGTHHIYHQYTGLVDEDQLGISRDEFVEALNAEGVPVIAYISMQNFVRPLNGKPRELGPVHRRPLFRKLSQTGRFGHYTFPEANRPDYDALNLPVTESVIKREFNFIQKWLNPPFDTRTMDQYVQAIHKVLEHREEIIARRNSDEPRHPRPILLTPDKSDAHEYPPPISDAGLIPRSVPK